MITNHLVKSQLKEVAPAVFADQPWNQSERYSFIPTVEIVKTLERHGWYPVRASQTRKFQNVDTARYNAAFHSVTFHHKDNLDLQNLKGEVIPEFVISTDHMGCHSFKMYMGLYRVLCENGLLTCTLNIEALRIPHKNAPLEMVKEGVDRYIMKLPSMVRQINEYKKIDLSFKRRIHFASEAMDIKYHNSDPLIGDKPEHYLQPRRTQDESHDLWTTFNVVQENIMKGGILIPRFENERKTRVRRLTGTQKIINVNLQLWNLLEKYATRS